jgi:hypothetical protein
MKLNQIMPTAALWFALWFVLLAGCVTPQTEAVKKVLNSYLVGVTTFADFRRDTDLIALDIQSGRPQVPQPKIFNFNGRYGMPFNSPWRLYGSSEQYNQSHGRVEQKWTYQVGDANGPICNLCFNSSGKLIEIYPAK